MGSKRLVGRLNFLSVKNLAAELKKQKDVLFSLLFWIVHWFMYFARSLFFKFSVWA